MAAMMKLLLLVAAVLAGGAYSGNIHSKYAGASHHEDLEVFDSLLTQTAKNLHTERRCRATRCLAFIAHLQQTNINVAAAEAAAAAEVAAAAAVAADAIVTHPTITEIITRETGGSPDGFRGVTEPISSVSSRPLAESSTLTTSADISTFPTTKNLNSVMREQQLNDSASIIVAQKQEIARLTKLGAQYLKLAAQQSTTLSAADSARMNDDAMAKLTRSVARYARTLSGENAPAEALSSPDSWPLRQSRQRVVPTCKVTSGYWNPECECQFILRPQRPHGPKPQDHHSWKPTADSHHHSRPHKDDDSAKRLDCIFSEFECFLDYLTGVLTNQQGMGTDSRRYHGKQLIKTPLEHVASLQSLVKNQKLVRSVMSEGGLEMESFLTQKLSDVEAIASTPNFMADQFGDWEAELPLTVQVKTVIERLEPYNH